MRWLPSTRTRYLLLFVSLLSVVTLVEGIAKFLVDFGGLGVALALWLCFGTCYAWLLVEPIVDAGLVFQREYDQDILERIRFIGTKLSEECGIKAPTFMVYRNNKFDVMVVGIGRDTTIFISEIAAKLPDEYLRAVLAHEYGHIHLGHSATRLLIYSALLVLAMVGGSTPFLAILSNVFFLWIMRKMEYAADGFAANIVGDDHLRSALVFIEGMIGDVPKWQTVFSTHPSFKDRFARLR